MLEKNNSINSTNQDAKENISLENSVKNMANSLHEHIRAEKIKQDVRFDYEETVSCLPEMINKSWKKTKIYARNRGLANSFHFVFQESLNALNVFLDALRKEMVKK